MPTVQTMPAVAAQDEVLCQAIAMCDRILEAQEDNHFQKSVVHLSSKVDEVGAEVGLGPSPEKVERALAQLGGNNLRFHAEASKAGWSQTLD